MNILFQVIPNIIYQSGIQQNILPLKPTIQPGSYHIPPILLETHIKIIVVFSNIYYIAGQSKTK